MFGFHPSGSSGCPNCGNKKYLEKDGCDSCGFTKPKTKEDSDCVLVYCEKCGCYYINYCRTHIDLAVSKQ